VHDVLPAAYGARRDNRGFEALAVSPDESTVWALLQSPLEHPAPKAGRHTGNVRLLAFDISRGRPAAEYLYRLGDPSSPGFLTDGAPPDDGKLCAMAAIDARTLLVLEQADGGLARLYRCSLATATDILHRPETPACEEVRDLPAAGIEPLRKELVADLANLRPAMLRDVYGEDHDKKELELKLEGLAILDSGRVALVNDNDFGVHAPKGASSPPRTCLWVVAVAAEALRPDPAR
jgi:hypothetical protein